MTQNALKALRDRLRKRPRDEGSGALYLIFGAMLLLVLAGFLIDGGLAIHQRERAADIAEQAARYAANHVQPGALRADGTVDVDPNPACSGYVQAFVQQSDSKGQGSCTAAGGNTVTVEVRLVYEPVLMKLLGSTSITVRGVATAQAKQEQ